MFFDLGLYNLAQGIPVGWKTHNTDCVHLRAVTFVIYSETSTVQISVQFHSFAKHCSMPRTLKAMRYASFSFGLVLHEVVVCSITINIHCSSSKFSKLH